MSNKNNLPKPSRGGSIETNWREIKWNRRKLFFVSGLLGFPYLGALLVAYFAKAKIIVLVLVLVAILVGVLFAFLRWLEQAEL